MSRRFGYLKASFLLFLFASAGCQKLAKHYTLNGEVLVKDVSSGTITVDGDNIPGFMPAMTMNYSVKDSQGLQRVEPGDKIRADVVVNGNNTYWLEHIAITDQSSRGTITATQPRELLRGEEIPDVPLVDQDGRTFHLSDFKGKSVLLTFIYTRCPFPTFCPLITSEFAKIHATLAQTPSIYDKTHLLSISLDPKFDTPPVLRKYGLAYLEGDASGFAQWSFASTSPEDLKKLASAFDLVYFQENNVINHSMNTILLAPNGAVEQMWPGNEWTPSQIVEAVKDSVTDSKSLVASNAKKK
jgi:protein SCO1